MNQHNTSTKKKTAQIGLLVLINVLLFISIIISWKHFGKSVHDSGGEDPQTGSSSVDNNQTSSTASSASSTTEPGDLNTSGSGDEQTQTDAAPAGSGDQNQDHVKEDVYYTVRCMYEDGEVFQDKIYRGEAGSSVSVTAPAFEGLLPTPERLEKTLSSDDNDNVFGFYYAEESLPEEDTEPVIPVQNVLHYNGHTYFAYRTKNIDSYWEALDYAESCGGYLAVITDSEENRAVYDYVFDDIGYESAYFGLTDDGSEDDWYWIDGSVYDYDSFAEGQPDNFGGNENYALFWYGDSAYRWNDGDFGKDAAGTVTFLIEWDSQ